MRKFSLIALYVCVLGMVLVSLFPFRMGEANYSSDWRKVHSTESSLGPVFIMETPTKWEVYDAVIGRDVEHARHYAHYESLRSRIDYGKTAMMMVPFLIVAVLLSLGLRKSNKHHTSSPLPPSKPIPPLEASSQTVTPKKRRGKLLPIKHGKLGWKCEYCSIPLKCDLEQAGQDVKCPNCKEALTFPEAREFEPANIYKWRALIWPLLFAWFLSFGTQINTVSVEGQGVTPDQFVRSFSGSIGALTATALLAFVVSVPISKVENMLSSNASSHWRSVIVYVLPLLAIIRFMSPWRF